MEACRRLKWETIPCIVFSDDDLVAEQREITENLLRSSFTAAEEVEAIQRLGEIALAQAAQKEADEAAELVKVMGGSVKQLTKPAKANGRPPMPGSTRDLAARHGVSHETVSKAKKRMKALGPATIDQVVRTDLDKPSEL